MVCRVGVLLRNVPSKHDDAVCATMHRPPHAAAVHATALHAPTKALAKSVKPTASGASEPWPGLEIAVAYTTITSVKVMISCGNANESHSEARQTDETIHANR